MSSRLDEQIAEMSQRVLDAETFEGARYLHYQLDRLIARRDGTPMPRPLVRKTDGRGRVRNRSKDGRLKANRQP